MSTEEKVTRKLIAILSADVKGYSLLMADDEVHTIQTLKAYRKIISDLISEYSGRVVDSPGDNILAEFKSAVEAVECAVKIQRKLDQQNSKFVDEKKVQFRIGVNIGDVVQDGDRIYGNGVNVAARIEGLTEPGGVCISRNAYDHIKNKLSVGFEYIGAHTVKNIAEPVRVYRVLTGGETSGEVPPAKKRRRLKRWLYAAAAVVVLLIAAGTGLYWKYWYLPDPVNIDPQGKISFNLPKGPSIAVLPFSNMSKDPDQEYFCDGITENIISALSHYPRILVIARNSTFAYKGKSVDVRRIGSELGAQYVLEGSVQKTEQRIRVTAQLIDTESGSHLWSERYDRDLKDIFALQDELTIKITVSLGVEITGKGVLLWFNKINDLVVLEKVMRASKHFYLMDKGSPAILRKEAKEIIAIAPDVVQAHILLGFSHLYDIWYGTSTNPLVSLGKATQAARKAVALDDQNDVVHTLMGQIFFIRKEFEKAIAEYKRAIHLNPNNDNAYTWLGLFLAYSGSHAKAIDFCRKAIQLNPFAPGYYFSNLGIAYRENGQYKKAIEAIEKGIEIDPTNIHSHVSLTLTYSLWGREKDASKAAMQVLKIDHEFDMEKFIKILPIKNEERQKQLVMALRKAGLK